MVPQVYQPEEPRGREEEHLDSVDDVERGQNPESRDDPAGQVRAHRALSCKQIYIGSESESTSCRRSVRRGGGAVRKSRQWLRKQVSLIDPGELAEPDRAPRRLKMCWQSAALCGAKLRGADEWRAHSEGASGKAR